MEGSMGTPFPAVDPSSPTGYEMGMRKVILPQVGVDGCHWIMHTQKLLADGGWRIRFTDIDNYPVGREIHWSHGFIWWLIFLGKIHSISTELPLPASIEAVAPYANTLILVFLIMFSPWIVYRRFGPIAASGLALGLSSIYVFYEFFMVGNADHHGIAAASSLICALCLAVGGAGWIANDTSASPQSAVPNKVPRDLDPASGRSFKAKPKNSKGLKSQPGPKTTGVEHAVDERSARRFFIGSAAAGSISLWVSAATAVPTFFGIGLGALISAYLFGRSQSADATRYHPELWRLWGLAGCIGSLFFYLLEYFPFHMGMRLEVNHPLYSLAWLGGGEILSRLTRWTASGEQPWKEKTAIPTLVAALGVVALLPCLIFFFPQRFFWVYDQFLWNFHKDYIHEFKTFPAWLSGRMTFQVFVNFCAFPLLFITVLRLLFLRELGRSWKGTLTLIILPAMLLTLLGMMQVRWLGIANSLWISTIPICLGCIFKASFAHRFWIIEMIIGFAFACFVFVAFPFSTVYTTIMGFDRPADIGPEEAFGIYIRDMSYALRRANKDQELAIVSGPTTTTYMMYYGGMHGIGTLYWENVPGLKATAEIYAARTSDEALALCKRNKVSHIAIFKSDSFAFQYTRLLRGLPFGAEPKDAFIPSMISMTTTPTWIKPLHFSPPRELAGEWLVLLEVKPEQTIAQAYVGLSEFSEARGDQAAAINYAQLAIQAEPQSRDAWFRLGALQLMTGGLDAAKEAIDNALNGLPPSEAALRCEQLAMRFYGRSGHSQAAMLFRRSLEALPDQPAVTNALAWLLATTHDDQIRNPEEALKLAQANSAFQVKAAYLDTLAAALAANGNMDEAVATINQAIQWIETTPTDPFNPEMKVLLEHRQHYEAGLSFRTGGAR